jgi:hypothetical protein
MTLPIVLHDAVPYDRDFRRYLSQYHERLWERLDLVPTFSSTSSTALLTYFLDLACHSQHIRNLTLGRLALWALPREWLLAVIEPIAEPFIQEQDEWVYRRLIEIYWTLDSGLAQKLAERGLMSSDMEIRHTAAECREKLTKYQRIDTQGSPSFHYWEGAIGEHTDN